VVRVHRQEEGFTVKEEALDFLTDEVFYAVMIDSVVRGASTILAAGPSGVLLRTESGTCLMASADEDAARAMLDMLDPSLCPVIVVHEDYAISLVEEKLGFDRHTGCLASAYMGSTLPQSERTDLSIEALGPQWVDTISRNYHMDGAPYIRGRIDAGEIWGAFRDEELTGFIGLHDEGSMGLLVVFDQYRRQGIAEYLVVDLANRLLAQGRTPHDHIIVGNTASESLQRKLGFTISTRTLCWMSRGDRGPCSDQS